MKLRISTAILLWCIAACGNAPTEPDPVQEPVRFPLPCDSVAIPRYVLIEVEPGVPESQVRELLAAIGLVLEEFHTSRPEFRSAGLVLVPAGDEDLWVERLPRSGIIVDAYRHYTVCPGVPG